LSKKLRDKSVAHKMLEQYRTVLVRKIALEGLEDSDIFQKEIHNCDKYLSTVDATVDALRVSSDITDNRRYQVLYYTFLTPKSPSDVAEILENISEKHEPMTNRTYQRLKKQAIETIDGQMTHIRE